MPHWILHISPLFAIGAFGLTWAYFRFFDKD